MYICQRGEKKRNTGKGKKGEEGRKERKRENRGNLFLSASFGSQELGRTFLREGKMVEREMKSEEGK